MEAVAFGSNGDRGITTIYDDDACGDFEKRFNRIWLIHNLCDREIKLLIGAQDNSGIGIGNDSITKVDYYSKLGPSFDVTLIIGKHPDSIAQGKYIDTRRMDFKRGEHQVEYLFPKGDVYITFGFKQNLKGCWDEFVFPAKKFEWYDWTRMLIQTITGDRAQFLRHPVLSAILEMAFQW
jgi:hypothetical protein